MIPLPKKRTTRQNRCGGLDLQIDAQVYNLYVLTHAEIKIAEGATK